MISASFLLQILSLMIRFPSAEKLITLLLRVLDKMIPDPPRPETVYRTRFEVFLHSGVPLSTHEGKDMSNRITTEEYVRVTVVPRTPGGKIANIDGPVTLTSSDDSIAEVIGDKVIGRSPGVVQIKATFDADLGAGRREIELTGPLEVIEPEAATGELVFDEPVLTPPAE